MATETPGNNAITDVLLRDRQAFGGGIDQGGIDQDVVALLRALTCAMRVRAHDVLRAGAQGVVRAGAQGVSRVAFGAPVESARAPHLARREKRGDTRVGAAAERAPSKALPRAVPTWLILGVLVSPLLGAGLDYGNAAGGAWGLDRGAIVAGLVMIGLLMPIRLDRPQQNKAQGKMS